MKKVPIISKYKKAFTKRLDNLKGKKAFNLYCYNIGLRQMSNQYLTYEQLESSRRAIARLVKPKDRINKKNQKVAAGLKKVSRKKRRKKSSKSFLLIRSTIVAPITKKPLQVRMGKGKGAVDSFVYISRSNRILLEFARKRFKIRKIHSLFKKAALKLPGNYRIHYFRNRKEKYFIAK